MARMHGKGRGVSESTYPYNNTYPHHVTQSKDEIVAIILQLARKGYKPSEIGRILRDDYGVGRVNAITGCSILRILKKNDCKPAIPEDLEALVVKCTSIKNHLNSFPNDKRAKFNLINIESTMHRVLKYYKRYGVMEPKWKPYAAKN